jgi:hypothetical protein
MENDNCLPKSAVLTFAKVEVKLENEKGALIEHMIKEWSPKYREKTMELLKNIQLLSKI